MNQVELLKILNDERDYEDRIVRDLFDYINHSVDDISDLSDEEKERVKVVLSTIGYESSSHSQMFTKLIEKVLEDDQIN